MELRPRQLLPGAAQRLGCLPCSATSHCAAPWTTKPPRQGLPSRCRCPLATAAAAPNGEDPLAAGGLQAEPPRLAEEVLLEPQLPEEQGAAAAYPGGSVDELDGRDVRTWQRRMHAAVRPVVASLQQQTVVLALAEQMQSSLQAGQGAAAEQTTSTLDQRWFLHHAAVLERCCERLR